MDSNKVKVLAVVISQQLSSLGISGSLVLGLMFYTVAICFTVCILDAYGIYSVQYCYSIYKVIVVSGS